MTTKLSVGLMQLGAAMALLPICLLPLGICGLFPLVPIGAVMAVVGLLVAIASRP